MSGETMVFGAVQRRSEKWRVYRIRTAHSAYELEVQTDSGDRRCAVLTCVEPATRAGETFEDSSPQVGDQSLYAVSPMDWIGRSLAVGTARTSEVQSVDFIATTSGRASLPRARRPEPSAAAPAPRPPPREERNPWAPFPLGSVEMAEAAAGVLQTLCRQPDLFDAVAHDAHLAKRLRLALAQAGLMLEALERRS